MNEKIPQLRFKEFTETWETKTLGEVAEIIGGGTPDTTKNEFWNGEISWFTPTEIKGGYVLESKRKITTLGLKNSSAKILPIGSILLTTRATIGDVAINKQECATNQGFQSFVVNKSNNNLFLYYWIYKNTAEFIKQASGSTFLEISKNKVSKLTISLPSLPEQTKIANFLSTIDAKITALSAQLAKTQLWKKGIMQQIFSQEIRFKDHNNQDFPDWKTKTLGEVAEIITKGTTPTSIGFKFTNEGINFIKIESLTEYGQIIPSKVAYISEQCHNSLKRSQLKVNDILFSIAGALGRIGIVNEEIIPANTNQALAIIRIAKNSGVIVKFLAKYFASSTIQEKIETIKGGAAQQNLSLGQLNTLPISLPSLPEQEKIANFLSAIDAKITNLSAQLSLTQLWKKGIMQQMFV